MLTFGQARAALAFGRKVARPGWERTGKFIYLVKGGSFVVNRAPLLGFFPEGTEVTYRQHIDVRNDDGTFGVWSPTQEDILADDWEIVD